MFGRRNLEFDNTDRFTQPTDPVQTPRYGPAADRSQRKIFRKTFPNSRPIPFGLFRAFFGHCPPAAEVDASSSSRWRIWRMTEWKASSTKWRRAADVSKNGQSHWLARASPSSLFTCPHSTNQSNSNQIRPLIKFWQPWLFVCFVSL